MQKNMSVKKNLEENHDQKIKRKEKPPLQINRGVELMHRRKKQVDTSDLSDVVFDKTFKIFGRHFSLTFKCY